MTPCAVPLRPVARWRVARKPPLTGRQGAMRVVSVGVDGLWLVAIRLHLQSNLKYESLRKCKQRNGPRQRDATQTVVSNQGSPAGVDREPPGGPHFGGHISISTPP